MVPWLDSMLSSTLLRCQDRHPPCKVAAAPPQLTVLLETERCRSHCGVVAVLVIQQVFPWMNEMTGANVEVDVAFWVVSTGVALVFAASGAVKLVVPKGSWHCRVRDGSTTSARAQ